MAPEINHFSRLGINPGASENEIKKAYRTLAKKWHPDKNKDIRAKETFQEIAASYEFLSSTDRREMHERELSKAAETTQPTKHSSMRTSKQTTASAPSPDKTKQTRSPSWSESFSKYYQDQQSKQSNYPHTKTFTFTSTRADFSFTFGNKEEKTFTSMSGEGDDPAELLREARIKTLMEARGRTKKKPQQRHVAPESGDNSGLDTAYLFSPRPQKPGEDRFQDKLPCPWCGAPFTPGKLLEHEEKCGKFGLSADEDEDSDSDGGCLTQYRQPGHCNMPVWQYQHQQLIRKIQQDKETYRSRPFRLGQQTTD